MSRLTSNRFRTAARALGALLTLVLLVLELLAADSRFHQAFHQNGKADANSCVLCLFAKGDVDLPPCAVGDIPAVQSPFEAAPRINSAVVLNFRYLVSRSRAPPDCTSLSAVMA